MSFPPFVLLVLLPTILVDSAAPPVLPSATFTAPKDDLPDGISELKLLTASDAGLMHGRLVMTEGPESMVRSFFRPPKKWNTFFEMQLDTDTSTITVEDTYMVGTEGITFNEFADKLCRAFNGTTALESGLALQASNSVRVDLACLTGVFLQSQDHHHDVKRPMATEKFFVNHLTLERRARSE